MNLLNYLITAVHTSYEECKKEAKLVGTEVNGSEIVGLVPKDALVMAGKFYADKATRPSSSENDLIQCAVDNLGLSRLAPFDPQKKIIDFMI